MIIAQTVLTSAPDNTQSSANPSSNGWWWLLPLVIGILGLVWYLRRKRNPLDLKSKSKPNQRTKASTYKTHMASLSEDSAVADTALNRNISSSKAGKKKKKNQSKSERRAKTVVPRQPNSLEQKKSELGEQKTSIAAPSMDRPETMAPVTVSVPAPAPVNAIFEPLFDVVQNRRKAIVTQPTVPSQANPTTVSTQPSGGRFERNIVTAAATRSIASRWPTPATQQRKTVESEIPKPQQLSQTDPISSPTTVSLLATVSPPEVSPAKGLTSFVSKVRSTVATNSDQTTVDHP